MKKIIVKEILNSFYCRYLFYFIIAAILFPVDLLSQTDEINKLEDLLSKVKGIEKINTLNKLSELSRSVSFEKANEYAEEALKLSLQENYEYGKAKAFNNIGFIKYRFNNLSAAEKYYKDAFTIFAKLNSDYDKARTLNYLGLIYWRRNDFVKAFKYYRDAEKISKSNNFPAIEAEATNYMGLIYWKWSQYSKALEYFFNSNKLYTKSRDNFGIGTTLNNISNMYNEMDQPDLAILYANKILSDKNLTYYKYVQGRTYNILGVSYFKKGDIEKAITFQKKSLEIKKEFDEKNGMAFSYNDLGEIYFKQKKYDLAYNNYKLALELRKELNDKFGISSTLLSIAKVQIATNKLNEAEKSLNDAIQNAKEINNLSLVSQAYKQLSDLYYKKGNISKAYFYLWKHSELVDSIYNKHSIEKIAELTVIYDLEAKEKELKIKDLEIKNEQTLKIFFSIFIIIVLIILLIFLLKNKKLKNTTNLLNEKNLEIAKKSKDLEQAIKTRDKFFSIISHDLRSPFFGIKSMTEILSDPNEVVTNEERIEYTSKLNKSIKDVYNLIENLIEWSKIQTNRLEHHPVNYDLHDDLDSILNLVSINADHKKIKIFNKLKSPLEVFADQQMIHSVLLNLISNAIKFTKENGLIEIYSIEEIDHHKICVKDNGIGMSDEVKSKIFNIESKFSTRGTNNETGTGLGLLLCKELVEKNGGVLSFESKENEGTTFCFTVPKAKK